MLITIPRALTSIPGPLVELARLWVNIFPAVHLKDSTHPISWTWNCWWTLNTPSPNGFLIVCTMCMLPQCITAWWELSRRYVTIFSTKHFVPKPKFVHKFCVCIWTIHVTGECFNMSFLSKWCEQLSVFMALVDQIKGLNTYQSLANILS